MLSSRSWLSATHTGPAGSVTAVRKARLTSSGIASVVSDCQSDFTYWCTRSRIRRPVVKPSRAWIEEALIPLRTTTGEYASCAAYRWLSPLVSPTLACR